jgi:hypothetical protein
MMEMTQNDQVVAWIKQTVETHYPNDVELVLLYGSYVNNTANAYSDVDCYFVPATDRGWELSRTFIINGIGYDLFGMDRSRVEGIAALRSFLTPLVGDAVILYAKEPSARAWFESLQKQLVNALSNPEVIANRNLERYQNATVTAMRLSKSTSLLRARFYAGQLIQELADIVALFNQTYFRHGLKRQWHDLERMPRLPERFLERLSALLHAKQLGEIKSLGNSLLESVRALCALPKHVPAVEQVIPPIEKPAFSRTEFVDYYQELVSSLNKIIACGESNNVYLAFLSAVNVQRELFEIARHKGFRPMNLLGAFDANHLPSIVERTRQIDRYLVDKIHQMGGVLTQYLDFESFVSRQ